MSSVDKNEIALLKLGDQLDKQRRLLQRVQCAYETERREWARLLHDEFGQSLAAIKSFAVGIKNSTESATDEHELAEIIQATADDLYVSAYDLMRGLRSGFIENIDLLTGIQQCVDNSRLAQKGIQVEIRTEGRLESLGHLMNVVILRMVQESLSGIVRSSSPIAITISISHQLRHLVERRKLPRNADTSAITNTVPMREVLELEITGDSLNKEEFDNYKGIFQRSQDYVEAFGGDYIVKQTDNSGIIIQIRLDLTDLIEDETE